MPSSGKWSQPIDFLLSNYVPTNRKRLYTMDLQVGNIFQYRYPISVYYFIYDSNGRSWFSGATVQGKPKKYRVTSCTWPCFWHLVKSDLSSVRYFTPIHWTSQFLQGTRNTRLATVHQSYFLQGTRTGHVYLVRLYLVKRDLSSVRYYTLALLFTRYQNKTAMFIRTGRVL